MRQIWLHIGSPKTGTTSLQGFLNDNAERLRSDGRTNFVESGRTHIAHNQLASAARMGDAKRVCEQICREADAMPDCPQVISSEMLFNTFTARKLAAAIPDDMKSRTQVIAYVRRQDNYLEALYKQLLKNSRIEPDRQAFLADARRRVRYLDTLNTYADVFGRENVVVRPFSSRHLIAGDVVQDFAAQIGLEITSDLKQLSDFHNMSFSAELSEMLAVMGERTDFRVREMIRELIAINHPGTIKSRDVFTSAERRGLMELMEPENRKLIRRFMPKHRDFFQAEEVKEDRQPKSEVDRLRDQIEDRTAATEAIMIAIGNLQARRKQERELAAEETSAKQASSALDEEFMPPSWYQEIYPGGDRKGWFTSLGDHSASFVERGEEQLVVSFDNLSQAGNDAYAREPWAQKFCEDRDFSHLGIYAQVPKWFRDAALIDHLEELHDRGFFKRFKNVAFVGTSMGAFGAMTFSSLAPGATVLAFSPQSTLDGEKVPWEGRFAKGRAADWSLPYSDAGLQLGAAKKAYLVYDPFHACDRAHIDRLWGRNIVRLKGFGLGHKSALVLSRMNALKSIMERGISGTLTADDFYREIRDRKDIYLYRQSIEGYLRGRGHDERAERFVMAFKRRRRLLNAEQSA